MMKVGIAKQAYNGAPHGIAQFSWEAKLDGWDNKRPHWSFDEELKTKGKRRRTPTFRTKEQLAMLASL